MYTRQEESMIDSSSPAFGPPSGHAVRQTALAPHWERLPAEARVASIFTVGAAALRAAAGKKHFPSNAATPS
jgi:hypothetical protein